MMSHAWLLGLELIEPQSFAQEGRRWSDCFTQDKNVVRRTAGYNCCTSTGIARYESFAESGHLQCLPSWPDLHRH